MPLVLRHAAPLLVALAVLSAACGSTVGRSDGRSTPPAARPTGDVTVFAAVSLTDALREVGTTFERTHPGSRVTFNFAASSQLRTQLDQGARADVFASADQAQIEVVQRGGLVEGDPRVFARNRLTLVAPRDNPAGIGGLRDLARPGLRLVAAQPAVPIGQYTAALLERASADPAYGPDFRARVEGNVVSREDNVRQVLAKVQLGEADGAVVYTSDVTPQVRPYVRELPLPDGLQVEAAYPIAVLRGPSQAGGQAFVAFVLSPEGQEILARWGFLPAGG